METEELVSGFCKKQNQTRMVFCEFECTGEGRRILISMDCEYGKCEHSQTCALMSGAKAGAVT
ncbi:MAG: ubiquinone biosynthesis protein UbiE [Clostridiales bacterium]|nr:ubiquinone biosynthesis protein UbiE [Clostridiales bacterium]